MNLSENQIESVKKWVSDGACIGEVQKRLASEWGVSMTYMEVRFLIDDIGAELVSKNEPQGSEPDISESAAKMQNVAGDSDFDSDGGQAGEFSSPDGYDSADSVDAGGSMEGDSAEGGSVSVSLSPIQRPDCIVSGDAVFSDGSKAEWKIDRLGQLSLIPEEGKKPPQEDMYEFQRKLQEVLSGA